MKTQSRSSRKLFQSESLEFKLATIDKGYVSRDDIIITRFRNLLQQLDGTYIENKQQIADMTVVAVQDLLRDKYGIRESLLNVMEGMNQVVPSKEGAGYKLYITAYVQLRNQGLSHQRALLGIESFLKSMERW